MDIIKILSDPKSRIVISIILGLGLAAAFKKTCANGKNCIIIKGPKTADVQGHVYKINDECYKYTARVVECSNNGEVIKS